MCICSRKVSPEIICAPNCKRLCRETVELDRCCRNSNTNDSVNDNKYSDLSQVISQISVATVLDHSHQRRLLCALRDQAGENISRTRRNQVYSNARMLLWELISWRMASSRKNCSKEVADAFFGGVLTDTSRAVRMSWKYVIKGKYFKQKLRQTRRSSAW